MAQEEQPKEPNFTIQSLPRGQYIISKGTKYCLFQFPIDHMLEDNLSFLAVLEEEIKKAIEMQKKEEEKKLKEKESKEAEVIKE